MTTHEKLIAAAAALLDQAGPEGVTLRAVGASAGVSHNAPYKHFADKEALLAGLAARELRAHDVTMRSIGEATPDPLMRLREMAKEHIAWATRHPRRFRLIFGVWNRHDDDLHVAAGEARQTLLEAVLAAQQSGAIRAGATEQTAAMLMALAHGAVDMFLSGHLALEGKGRSSPDALVEDLIDLLRQDAGSSV